MWQIVTEENEENNEITWQFMTHVLSVTFDIYLKEKRD